MAVKDRVMRVSAHAQCLYACTICPPIYTVNQTSRRLTKARQIDSQIQMYMYNVQGKANRLDLIDG